MNVLIICQYFPPVNQIGAIRPSRVAKYLSRYENVNVTVLTVESIAVDTLALQDNYHGVTVYRVVAPSFIKWLNNNLKRRINASMLMGGTQSNSESIKMQRSGIRRRIRGFLFTAREKALDCSYYSGAKKLLAKIVIPFDAVISTYNTEFGHKVGLWYKKKHPQVKWITDYRDPLWGSFTTLKQKKHGTEFVKRISKACDAVTVVSKGIIDIHYNDFGDKPVYLIYNGYDSEDSLPEPAKSAGRTVRIVYTGDLYNGKRDLSPLFHAISTLEQEKRLQAEDIEVVYAGRSEESFVSQIGPYQNIKHSSLGFISRQEALALQSGADILLLASWCEPNEKEILTGKFFEYLQMKKPIVCLISGSESGCRLTKIINEHSLGFSYEAASKETDHELLCNYLEKQVSEKRQCGSVQFVGDDEFVKKFDYKLITEKFFKIICGAGQDGSQKTN